MNHLIVTVGDSFSGRKFDLEVPKDVESEKLLDDILETLRGYAPELQWRDLGGRLMGPPPWPDAETRRNAGRSGRLERRYPVLGPEITLFHPLFGVEK